MAHRFVCPEDSRLDKAIADNTRLSRKRAKTLISRGGVRVDGTVRDKPFAPVKRGAVVEVRAVVDRKEQARIELPERYRDPWLLVVDKPSGLPSQAGRQGGRTHVYGLLGARERYVGLHHRLDTPASGLLLLTLDKAANGAIAQGFREGEIKRRYLAVVLGDPGPAGAWEAELDGKAACTRFERLGSAEGTSLLSCTLETGRTHQIRRHAAQAGHPILGDRRHGGAAGRAWPRLALHAVELRLPHPVTDELLVVEAPVPDDLSGLVAPLLPTTS